MLGFCHCAMHNVHCYLVIISCNTFIGGFARERAFKTTNVRMIKCANLFLKIDADLQHDVVHVVHSR